MSQLWCLAFDIFDEFYCLKIFKLRSLKLFLPFRCCVSHFHPIRNHIALETFIVKPFCLHCLLQYNCLLIFSNMQAYKNRKELCLESKIELEM